MDHVFAHLLMTYGAKNMVTEFAACLMVTAKRHKALDLRIEVRQHLGLLLGTEAPVMTPDSVYFSPSFLPFS